MEITVNKLFLAIALAFALVTGTVTVLTVNSPPVFADGCSDC